MKVTLRQRLKNGKISLFLDYYGKGRRKTEFLKLYLHPEPEKGMLTKAQKAENKTTLDLANAIRSKRHLEIQNGIYGFQNLAKQKGSLLDYIEQRMQSRMESQGNFDNWDSMLKHLRKFVKGDVTFEEIDKRWLESFKDYLKNTAKTPSNKPLSQNTQSSYFNKLRAALKEAYKEGIIARNPAEQTDGIKVSDTERQFLTFEELQTLVNVECEIPIMKKAFIFSAITGLRWSDVNKLVWEEVQHSHENGYNIRFRQQKTKETQTHPISDQAAEMLGERGKPLDRVFPGLKYSAWHNLRLQQWIMRAGITKNITFHCARHTYATLLLTFGADLYTVSKLLGHKDVRTTQVYAKIIDEKKQQAANKIQLQF